MSRKEITPVRRVYDKTRRRHPRWLGHRRSIAPQQRCIIETCLRVRGIALPVPTPMRHNAASLLIADFPKCQPGAYAQSVVGIRRADLAGLISSVTNVANGTHLYLHLDHSALDHLKKQSHDNMAGPVCTFEDRLSSGLNAAQEVAQGGHTHDLGGAEHTHGHDPVDEHGHTHEHLENAGECGSNFLSAFSWLEEVKRILQATRIQFRW